MGLVQGEEGGATASGGDKGSGQDKDRRSLLRILLEGGVVVALIAAAGGIIVAKINDDDPEPDAITAKIITAESAVAGQDNEVTVSAEGLKGRSLWVVTFPDEGDGYYMIQNSPFLSTDGERTFTDPQLGDASDRDHDITYLAYAANEKCADFLKAVDEVTPTIPDSCGSDVAHAVVHME